jgi:hypothetical protein
VSKFHKGVSPSLQAKASPRKNGSSPLLGAMIAHLLRPLLSIDYRLIEPLSQPWMKVPNEPIDASLILASPTEKPEAMPGRVDRGR